LRRRFAVPFFATPLCRARHFAAAAFFARYKKVFTSLKVITVENYCDFSPQFRQPAIITPQNLRESEKSQRQYLH
jgi:hypothetical protein